MTTLPAYVKKDQVSTVYSRVAPIYDLWSLMTETKARKRCLKLAQVHDSERVLEVAVGTGLVFRELLRQNPSGRCVGLDLTHAMLERARTKAEKITDHKNWELKIGDAYALDLPDNSFDLIVNNYMFDLLPEADFARVLSEFRRVLAPGGRMVLVNMTTGSWWWETIYRLKPELLGGCRGVELEDYLKKAGLVDVQRETLRQCGFPSEILLARRTSSV
ncbi:MAG: methyltransferase domain-containing protein [Bdellovibrio sp.]|nr:methyltransferase domain-containing protein [Bdellovibrio sp.]